MSLAYRLHPNKSEWVKKGGKISLNKEEVGSQNVTEINERETKESQKGCYLARPCNSQKTHITSLGNSSRSVNSLTPPPLQKNYKERAGLANPPISDKGDPLVQMQGLTCSYVNKMFGYGLRPEEPSL